MKKTTLETEKKLLPRLRFMGCVLLLFGAFACAYAIIADPYLSTVGLDNDQLVVEEEVIGIPEFEETPPFIVTSFERINLYIVAFIFSSIGAGCLLLMWKKKKEFAQLKETHHEEHHSKP
ncbi:MAG: hypothetical protein ACHQT8_01035 [Chlamydiales bacterium]